MPNELIYWLVPATTALFVFAVGACVGSLLNVLVYRLPLGLDVVRPQSRCPSCNTRLTWRENIPILGWLLLRGRCRFCRSSISVEYPIVEFFTAAVFCGLYLLFYVAKANTEILGMSVGAAIPEWASNGVANTWPIFVVLLVLIGCLIAMTLVDAKTYTIPLILTWVPSLAAVLILPGHAAWFEMKYGTLEPINDALNAWGANGRLVWRSADGWLWSLATPMPGPTGMRIIGASIGGTLGLGVSLLLMRFGLIRRSFGDYEAWEAKQRAELAAAQPTAASDEELATETEPDAADLHDCELWIQYPHARREMFKELAFLGAPAGLAWVGAWAAGQWLSGPQPLWLHVLGGVLLGYLVGGAVVWGVRILGSIAFGKEAMGMGDVHLMAAVGACVGWIDPVLAFFLAAFLGTGWEVARRLIGGGFNKALPYGPHLAAATVLVIVAKPLVEKGLSALLSMPIDLP